MKQSPLDPRALRALSFGQIAQRYPHYARALYWLDSCRVLRRGDFEQVVWPHPVRRQTRQHGLTRLLETDLVEAIDEQRVALQLGRRGAALLARAGVDTRYRRAPGERALPGLLIAGAFASALGRQLMDDPHVRAMQWRAEPYTGATLRPDGVGLISWTSTNQADSASKPNMLRPDWVPNPDDRVVQVLLEVDSGAERASALRARVRSWTTALDAPATHGLLDPSQLLVLWVTTGTWRRAETLRQLWASTTTQPAFFTTLYALRGPMENARLDLVRASWRNQDGQPISGEHLLARSRAR